MRLAETIAIWFGRVELVLAGVDGTLRDGEEALARGDGVAARTSARAVLARLPQSPVALALLADACEVAGLDAERALALEDLASRVPTRADVWTRVGEARRAVGASDDEIRDAFLRALGVAEAGSPARAEALFALTDLDLAQGDAVRAEHWLDRIVELQPSRAVALRRAELALAHGRAEKALEWLERVDVDATDGRAALVRGRALAELGDSRAFLSLLRALVLEAAGAEIALASAVARLPTDEALRARVRATVSELCDPSAARWRAAFSRAEGDRAGARAALIDAATQGDASAAAALLDAALEDRDAGALSVACDSLSEAGDATARLVADARLLLAARTEEPTAASLEHLATIREGRALAWAHGEREALLARWIPGDGSPSAWEPLLARLDVHARQLGALELVSRIADVAAERSRPLRLAVVGEFNAGKSTFINAMLGADVAPTGVLPTTATLHHLRYAPSAYARVLVDGEPDRVVPSAELRGTLAALDPALVDRVEIYAPLPDLARMEVLDTPGFNAPDPRHTDAAKRAFAEADICLWLLDAAQPLKQSERVLLEEARARKMPVQVLINKADRLGAVDRAAVLASVVQSMADLGIASWAPPLLFSAKQALRGKLGDGDALTESGWMAVAALIDAALVARGGALKERALRRRAREVTLALRETAQTALERDAAAAERAAQLVAGLAARRARIEETAADVAQQVEGALTPATRLWARDAEIVATGRPRAYADSAGEAAEQRYRVDRALAHLTPPLTRSLAALAVPEGVAAEGAVDAARWAPLARALVAGCSETAGTSLDAAALGRAAVRTLLDTLTEVARSQAVGDPPAWRLRELDAFAAALA